MFSMNWEFIRMRLRITSLFFYAKAVICSYNKINGVYAALNYDLMTKVLRNEWGFDGVVMTDWFATGHDEALDELGCKAGTDLIMPGTPMIPGKIMKALKAGQITREDMERSARRIVKLSLDRGETI